MAKDMKDLISGNYCTRDVPCHEVMNLIANCSTAPSNGSSVSGGPGSGKGTQCDRMVQKFGFTHLSSGDLLRDEVNSKTERAVRIKAIMDKGDLVPLETVLTLLKEAMMKNAAKSKGFLIDGYPRELEQGKKFEAEIAPVERVVYFQLPRFLADFYKFYAIGDRQELIIHALHDTLLKQRLALLKEFSIRVSDETMKSRIMKRGQTSGRSDDNEATVAKRLKTFHANNQPIVDHYHKIKKLCQIQAEGSIDEIFNKVVSCLQGPK